MLCRRLTVLGLNGVLKERYLAQFCRLVTTGSLALLPTLPFAVTATPCMMAQTYTVLHNFGRDGDGIGPWGLIKDATGIYGITQNGGTTGCSASQFGCGILYRLNKTGYTVMHYFAGSDGEEPAGRLIRDSAGNLYATAAFGGRGHGVVFMIDAAGTETVLYNFTGGADGSQPEAGLVRDSAGNLYGTTEFGGTTGQGVVFQLNTAGTLTPLHSFAGPDGEQPTSPLTRDSAGNLYGTTQFGGPSGGVGVVFKVDASGTYTVLHTFKGRDGAYPSAAGLVRDFEDNLYGTTANGGATNAGVVFELENNGTYRLLHEFSQADGQNPNAGMTIDSAGDLYGTTAGGGSANYGVVFKLNKTGCTVLHNFTGADGSFPLAAMIQDSVGNLYGTTFNGGSLGKGVLFKLTP